MSYKLKFLELQLELLDDYRIRLLQIKNGEANMPLSPVFCAILNTVSYVAQVLQEWSELVVSVTSFLKGLVLIRPWSIRLLASHIFPSSIPEYGAGGGPSEIFFIICFCFFSFFFFGNLFNKPALSGHLHSNTQVATGSGIREKFGNSKMFFFKALKSWKFN